MARRGIVPKIASDHRRRHTLRQRSPLNRRHRHCGKHARRLNDAAFLSSRREQPDLSPRDSPAAAHPLATSAIPRPGDNQESGAAEPHRSAPPRYTVAAPIASAAQAPNKVHASMASALSGLRQRCRENNDAGFRQASMTRLQSLTTRWRRPRNLASRRLSRRDGNRTTAHWTMRRVFVYERRRYPSGIDMQLPLRRHRAEAIAMVRWWREPASAGMPAAPQHGASAVLYLLTGNATL